MKEIIMTSDMARDAESRGMGPFELASERFFIEHGLSFEPREFATSRMFEYAESTCGEYFKIVYKGDLQ